MLLGQKMPGRLSGWRFVEGDLHDIVGRVVEYDRDARLVRDSTTGQLGLARWVCGRGFIQGGRWSLARRLHDPRTDRPLTGEPDGRVIQIMRAADSWGRDMRAWYRDLEAAEAAAERREHAQMHDEHGDPAERFVHAMRKDVSARPRAFIPADVPRAA